MRITLLSLVFLAACGSSNRSGTPDAPVAGDAAGDGQPTGTACGGPARAQCKALEYCDYADNGCGIGDQTGTCKRRPDACPLAIIASPTCACDARIYNSECEAAASGFDLNAHGTCDVAPGRFTCGYLQCEIATQYCRREPHLSSEETFTCAPLSCTGTPSCACLAKERCGNACMGDSTVGLTLTCSPSA